MKPYSIVEENEKAVTYEYKTIYVWVLYGILLLIASGVVLGLEILSGIGIVFMVIYFLTVSIEYRKHGKEIKEATERGSIEIGGNKLSFKNPLRVTISKETEI